MDIISQSEFVRHFSIMNSGEIDFFIGAGASVQSGIPTGQQLIWHFKRELYCTENNIPNNYYKDLMDAGTQNIIQEYIDKSSNYSLAENTNQYSYFFEKCYPNTLARKRFIETMVSGRNPSVGYLSLANFVINKKVRNIWTTNFDSLLENSIKILDPLFDVPVISSANHSSLSLINANSPLICKLHGDYRYDFLKNTDKELQSIEDSLYDFCQSNLNGKGLFIVGYSGSDESVMSFLEKEISNKDFLSKGLYWAIHKSANVPHRVVALLDKQIRAGKEAKVITIDGFDEILFSLYSNFDKKK